MLSMYSKIHLVGALLTVLVKAKRNKCTVHFNEEDIWLACLLIVLAFQIVSGKGQNNN